jgi:hypothetical protein
MIKIKMASGTRVSSLEKKKQPELVRPLKQKITIRANWDNEFEITL